MRRYVILIMAMTVIACQSNNKSKEKTPPGDSVSQAVDTNMKTTTEQKVADSSDEMIVTRMLLPVPGGWRVMQDKDVKEEFDKYERTEERKKYADYPYVAVGDFNGDGIKDYAAVVTNDKKEYDHIITRIILFPSGGKPVFDDSYCSTYCALHTIKKATVLKDPMEEKPDIKLKYDAILVTNGDGPGNYLRWNGKKFESFFEEG